MAAIHEYFMSTTSPTGFSGLFEQLIDNYSAYRTYIIKAGPGCGKSSMMRRIADRIVAAGHDIELIHCSSDPLSLDAVLCRDLKFAIADGTDPHVLEPSIPAAKQEVVSLHHCIDNAKITANFEKLRVLFDLNAQYVERAKRFVAAAGSLYFEIERTAKSFVLNDKVKRYAENLAAKTMPKKSDRRGRETLRFSSAITSMGVVDFAESNFSDCSSVHIFEDRYGAAAHALLDVVRDFALAGGSDIVTCRCPMSPFDKIDTVFVPSLSLAFVHSSYISPVSIKSAHVVRDRRFYDSDPVSACQKRLAFSKKAALKLLDEAGTLLSDAKTVHDEIEEYYIANVDFSKIREREKQICVDIGLEP